VTKSKKKFCVVVCDDVPCAANQKNDDNDQRGFDLSVRIDSVFPLPATISISGLACLNPALLLKQSWLWR
jgi:hypothetical protein